MILTRKPCSKRRAHLFSFSFACLTTFVLAPAAAMPIVPQTEALRWFNYFFDTTTTLVHGIKDSDYTPVFFECEWGNPTAIIHIEHEPVRLQDGQTTPIQLRTADVTANLTGTALYQAMDDLMRVEAPMAADESLQRLLASGGTLFITIEERTRGYSLKGIEEPAAKLMQACLADPGSEPPPVEDGRLPTADVVQALSETSRAVGSVAGHEAVEEDPWPGFWSGNGMGKISARIRRGTAKPEYIVVDLVTGMPGCSGAVTLYGRPEGRQVYAESYDANDRSAPVCFIRMSLDSAGTLVIEEEDDCGYYRGASCIFEGSLELHEK